MAFDYFILVFIASVGVYQIVAIHAKLDGLCFFRKAILQYIFGITAIVGAFAWFFASRERNVHSAVEGSQQLGLFLAAIVVSYIVTAILASIIQAKVRARIIPPAGQQYEMGIETLKTNTLIGSILSNLKTKGKDKT